MIIIATHAVFLHNKDVYGPPHAVSLFLNKNRISHIFIKHRLEGDGYSRVEYYEKGKLKKTEERGRVKRIFFLFQYLLEFIITLKIALTQTKEVEVFIGVDPLNSLAGYVLRLVRKTRKIVYFSADFALKRFDNPFMNSIYLLLDNFAMKRANFTWSISKRIIAYRRKKGLSSKKNLILPNAPFFNTVPRRPFSQIRQYDLVIVAKLTEGIAFTLLFDAVKKLQKKIPKIRLLIIGSGEKEQEYKMYVKQHGLANRILFLGPKSHEKMFEVLVRCGVGIALYNYSDIKHFHYFSDSMKVRDYLASGLPSLISGNSGIVEEVEKDKAGFPVKVDIDDFMKKVCDIVTNEKRYLMMRENAINLAKKYDTYSLLDRYFQYLKEK